jgi:hypothetical protein
VQPLILAMWVDALKSPYLCTDATGVLVQHEKKCRRGHFFVVAAPERHILFGYSPDHNSKAVDELLGGYKGKLIADAHTIYDCLPPVRPCLARAQGKSRTEEAMNFERLISCPGHAGFLLIDTALILPSARLHGGQHAPRGSHHCGSSRNAAHLSTGRLRA